jgi:hypothetical protein
MKKILLFIAISFVTIAKAQTTTFNFAKSITSTYVLDISDVTTDSSGNVLTTGYYGVTANIGPNDGSLAQIINPNISPLQRGIDGYVTKMSPTGALLWTKRFGGSADNNYGKAIKTDAAGNVYVAGTFIGQCDFNPEASFVIRSGPASGPAGVENTFIIKYGPTGNFLWVKTFVGVLKQDVTDIDVDAQGNVFTTGLFQDKIDFDPGLGTNFIQNASSSDIFISKLNTNGEFVWVKSFSGNGFYNNDNKANDIELDNLGNILISGSFTQTMDFDPSAVNYILTSHGSYEESDAFVAKLNSLGQFVWAKKIGGPARDYSKAIGIDGNNNIYLYGYYSSDSVEPFVDFDPGIANYNLTPLNKIQNAVVKLNPTGDFQWAKLFYGNSTGEFGFGRAFDVDVAGNFYINEAISGSVSRPATYDFDDSDKEFILTSTSANSYLAKYNNLGGFVAAFLTKNSQAGGLATRSVRADESGGIITIGTFDGNYSLTNPTAIDFDPTQGLFELKVSTYNVFIQKVTLSNSLSTQNYDSKKFIVYPNPASNNIYLSLDNNLENAHLKIISILGQTVLEKQNISGNKFSADVSNLSSGTYIVQLQEGSFITTSKFIKQ